MTERYLVRVTPEGGEEGWRRGVPLAFLLVGVPWVVLWGQAASPGSGGTPSTARFCGAWSEASRRPSRTSSGIWSGGPRFGPFQGNSPFPNDPRNLPTASRVCPDTALHSGAR